MMHFYIKISGVVVPGELGILLIYAPVFFFLNGPAKDERPVSYTVTCNSLAYLVHSKMGSLLQK